MAARATVWFYCSCIAADNANEIRFKTNMYM